MENVIVNDTDITKYVTSFEVYDEMDQDSIIGSTVSTQIKLKLNNKDGQLDKYLDYPFFIGDKTYTVYEKPSKWTRTISLVLYDKMILTNIPYVTELPETTTIEAQLDEMAQLINISIDKSTLSSDILNRTVKWKDKTLLIRTYIGYIAQLDGKNAFIENDVIKFKSLAEKRLDIDFCSNYEINEVITFTRVYYDNGTVIYSRGNRNGNTIYLDSNNRYINESDVERIFSQYDHLSFYSFKKFRCWKTQDIHLTDLITYNGMTFMPIGIKRTVNGGEAKDSLELSGDIQIKNAENIKVSTNPNEEIKKMVVDQIEATKAEFDRLNAEYINVSQQLVANRADINTLNASVASIEEAYISKAEVSQLYATKAEVGTITSNVAEIQKAIIDVAYIDDLNVLEAKINEIIAGSVTTEYLEANYAKINLSNIENGCITTAMIGDGVIGTVQIADGSITDAKIVGLTANKITAGTIDASDIEVINLNCANLTVGTINGQQIANNAIDWDKLSSQVSGSITEAGDNANQALEDALEAFQKAQEALNSANNAQTTANGKNTVFYQSTQPAVSGRKVSDIWYDTDDGYKMYYFNGTSWQAVEFGENAIADDAISADKIASDVNSKINDAFTNAGIAISDSSNALSKANTAIADSATALSTANSAKSTADGKNSVFYQTNAPSTSNRKVNDVWFDTDDSNKMYYWNGSAWTARQFGTNAIANLAITNALIADGTIQNAKIANLDAAKITSGYINVSRLQAGSITADKLKADTITAASGVIADAAILTANIADLAVSSGKIANAAIGTAKIADLAVTNAKLADLSVTNAKIADATIQSAKIASLDAGKITSGYISSDRIQAGSLVIGKLDSSTQNTINNAYSTANNAVLTTAMASGKMLFTDPSFATGNNALSVYNNSANGTVTMTRISRPSDSPITSSGYVLEIRNTGTSSPGCGGFRWSHGVRANAVFIYKIIAKLPSGRSLVFATNSIGTGNVSKWIANPTGDGNNYKEYIYYVHCGYTGSFSSTGFFYLNGEYGSTSSPVTWYVAYATCFDCTNVNLDYNSIISNWCYNNDETYINGGKIYTGTVAASQIAANAITSDKISANAVIAGKIATNAVTTGTIAADAVTSAKIAADAITAEHVAANAITTDNIVAGAVTGAKIAASTITANNIAANTITAAEIAAGTITATEIDAGSIRTAILTANSIISTMVAANAITSDKIAANAITSAKIATDAIKSRNYVANSTGSYLNMSDGSFSSKNLKWTSNGTITATNGSFSGTITANSGAIGGWKLSDTFIYNDYDINSTTRNRMYLDSSRNAFGVRKEVLSNGVWKETTTVEYTYIGLGISNGDGTSKYTKVFLSEDMLSFTVDKDKNYSCNYTEKGIEVYGQKEYASFKYNNGKRGFAIDYSLNVGEDVAANRFLLNVNGTNRTLLWADSSNDWATRLNSGNKGNGIIIHGSTFHDANIYINAPNNNPVVQFNNSDSQMLGRVYFDSNGLMKCRTEKDANTIKYIVASTNLKEISYIYNSGNRYVQFMSGANLYGVDVWVSDRRLKRNILDSKVNALEKLMRIRHCSYILNDGNFLVENGYIADELEIIDKNFVFQVGDYKQPSVQHLIPLLSKSIQEQQLIINGLISEINKLNAKLDAFINGNFEIREVTA